jgi:hypothetical protein
VSRLLGANQNESGGLFVGDLTLHLIRRTGAAILPVLPNLLRAFLTRLASAVTMTFTQSLVLPFAYLIHTQLDTVITLVESIQVNGRSGLEVLLSAWTSCHQVIQGYWNTRISYVQYAPAPVSVGKRNRVEADGFRACQKGWRLWHSSCYRGGQVYSRSE